MLVFRTIQLFLLKILTMDVIILTGVAAYLIGSFSSAFWFGNWFADIDIREHGSKNAGATNLLRVVGWKLALPAFVTDALKAFLAVNLALLQDNWTQGTNEFALWQIALGLLAVVGHIFPVFTSFRGGKGVASLLGIVLALNPLAALLALSVFIIVFICTRIVSVASMSAGISFPFLLIFALHEDRVSMVIFSIVAAVLLVVSHKKNIKRLLNKEEKRIAFKKV